MEEYLQTTKHNAAQLGEVECVHVVLCNQSCDLDSAVSALVYAYFLHKTCGRPGRMYLPVLNIPRHQYRLRTEITYLLGCYGLSAELLTFFDDVDLVSLAPRLQLTLVDHHVPTGQSAQLETCVVEVIDHRPVEKQWDSSVKSTVELVGSCCTLIMETVTQTGDFHLDTVTASLLLGTILTDTINLSPAAGKTTPRDIAAVERLRQLLPDINQQLLYDNILQAKSDLSGLSCLELLEKDSKLVTGPSITIAMCSIMMNMQDLLTKGDLVQSLQVFSTQKTLAAVVIMTLSTPNNIPQRQLAIFSRSRIYRHQIGEVLQASDTLQLEIADSEGQVEDINVFNQANVQASRKKVMPILKAFLNGERTPDGGSRVSTALTDRQDDSSSLVDLLSSDPGKEDSARKVSNTLGGIEYLDAHGNHDTRFDTGTDKKASEKSDNHNSSALDIFFLSNSQNACQDIGVPGNSIDTLINTNSDDFELNDVSNLTDFLYLDSPMEMASGQNSSQGSKMSSYPVTPPNSFMDSNFSKEHNLPSFNSSEMVERIRAKKASLEGLTGFDCSDSSDMQADIDSTFTPQNSYSDSSMDKYMKETELPSFHSSEMVQRIRKKRASLENALITDNQEAEEEDKFPWTPHNSYVDMSLDRFEKESLPSFNNAEMMRKVQEKRESLPSLDENENEAGAGSSNVTTQPCSAQYTPQNSFIDGQDGSVERTDMSPLVDRLAGASVQNKTTDTTTTAVNIVSRHIAEDMLSSFADVTPANVPKHFETQEYTGNIVAAGICEEIENLRAGNESNNVTRSRKFDSLNGRLNGDGGHMNMEEEKMSETAINEVAFALANDLIQTALETFSVSESKHSLEGVTLKQEQSSLKSGDSLKQIHKLDCSHISVETEYLPEMDPLHGNMDIVENTSLETDAMKEVVESSSFRKISGQESTVSHKEILEQLRHEMEAERHSEEKEEQSVQKTVRKHIYIDPDLSIPLEEPATEASEELNKKKVIHVRDEEKLRFSLSSDIDDTQDDSRTDSPVMANQHPFSGSVDDRKEVFLTTAGTTSGNVDEDADLSRFNRKETLNMVTDTSHKVGFDVGQHSAAVHDITSLSEDFVIPTPVSHTSNFSTPPVKACELPQTHTSTSAPLPQQSGGEMTDVERKDDEFAGSHPDTLNSDGHTKKKIVPDLTLLSDEDASEGHRGLKDPPSDPNTPLDLDDSDLGELEWEDDETPAMSPDNEDLIPEYTEKEEKEDAHHWKMVTVGDRQFRIDLRVIEPYKKVLSHGGYYGDGLNAIILFSGCYLPDRRRKDYNYVMDNLFHYVVNTLEQLVAEDYMIVYFHGATPRRQMPSLSWLKKCYQMIDRRLRKNLKALLLVHPTLWLRTVVMMTRPFISAKFRSKLRFVHTLQDLTQLIPMNHVYVPEQVQSYDDHLHSRRPLSNPSTPHSDPASP